jgi:Flp pilus assembly protein protease CpaA
LVPYLPLVALLSVAIVIDWRERRIPNWLNGLTLAVGVVMVGLGWIPVTPLYCLLGVLSGFALVLPRVLLGFTGAGDLKQHMAVGAWMGPLGILLVLLAATVAGAFVAIIQAAQAGKFSHLCRNVALLSINLVHVRQLGVDHMEETGKQFRSIDRPLPYAVPMLAGVVVVVTARAAMGA